MNKILLAFIFVFSFTNLFCQQTSKIISTAVPFLLITPDARSSGLGDNGVATSADAFSQQYNPAKYLFSNKESEIGFSYTPYLNQLVDDIFLANGTFYKKKERTAWAVSLKYFSLGDIQLNDLVSGSIVSQGVERPNELTIDFSYSILLNDVFSLAIASRYIRSDLQLSNSIEASSSSSIGFDIAGFHQGNPFDLLKTKGRMRFGFNISNIGPPIEYSNQRMDYLPTNLKIGTGIELIFNSNNSLTTTLEFNKLLVPSPVELYDKDGEFLGFKQPETSFLDGIISSFNDAPEGFKEELREITWGLGVEYAFQNSFFLRTGYFNESPDKGSRNFLSLGAGFTSSKIKIDLSYLLSASEVRNPLQNTIRFSLAFDLKQKSSLTN